VIIVVIWIYLILSWSRPNCRSHCGWWLQIDGFGRVKLHSIDVLSTVLENACGFIAFVQVIPLQIIYITENCILPRRLQLVASHGHTCVRSVRHASEADNISSDANALVTWRRITMWMRHIYYLQTGRPEFESRHGQDFCFYHTS
jgi:hypothetical protein